MWGRAPSFLLLRGPASAAAEGVLGVRTPSKPPEMSLLEAEAGAGAVGGRVSHPGTWNRGAALPSSFHSSTSLSAQHCLVTARCQALGYRDKGGLHSG